MLANDFLHRVYFKLTNIKKWRLYFWLWSYSYLSTPIFESFEHGSTLAAAAAAQRKHQQQQWQRGDGSAAARWLLGDVGTLNDEYIRKVPLPCAPLIQSTRLVTCNATVTHDTGDTCYLEQVPRIPMWHNLPRSIARICRTMILTPLPVGLI